MPDSNPQPIAIDVQLGDVRTIASDVLALKSGRALYGATLAVVNVLEAHGAVDLQRVTHADLPILVEGAGHLGARQVLFQPTPPLAEFRYAEIRDFSRNVLRALATSKARVRTLALTLHGIGFGLDEAESFRAELAGLVDAVEAGICPPDLEHVVIVEAQAGRVERLRKELAQALPHGITRPSRQSAVPLVKAGKGETDWRTAGLTSDNKPYVFIAMPFAEDYADVFEYGIQNAVRRAFGEACLCERADLSTFTGDVMAHVRARIEGSTLVIADLTSANANVYLEIGYAWGCERRTVLIVNAKNKDQDVKFDLRGQRYLEYRSIKDLETRLAAELQGLAVRGVAR